MARIAGVNLPLNKRVEIGLTYVHGVGRSTANELLKAHDGFAAKGRASLVGASEDTIYNTNWQLKMKGQVVGDDPRYQVIQDTLTHLAHHRGQLTVYLRLMDAKVASTYGPSADDNPWAPPKAAGA